MASVMSGWAQYPPALDGTLSSTDWKGAGVMPIPAGFLLAKNDSKFLYIALDMVGDTGKDAGTQDYFWFSADVDSNASITAKKDVNYGLYPSPPHPANKIGRQFYLKPGAWTGLLNEPTTSAAVNGFGTSSRSATPHRIWEIRIALSEIAAELHPGADPPVVRCGLRVASSSPAFTFDSPSNFYKDFSNLHQILLSMSPVYPAGTAGAVLAGVGLIPAGQINAQGYATTAATYYLPVKDSAFGGRMNVIGNRTTINSLWGSGARKYRILHRRGALPFTPISQTWTNYRWTGSNFVLESYGPDASQMYPLPNPGLHYSINDLLLQWNSSGFTPGLYQFRAEFFTAAAAPVSSPAQVLTLRVDNTVPTVDIVDIMYGGSSVPACGIVNLASASDVVVVKFTAWEPDGHLHSYNVDALYGDNQSAAIESAPYPAPATGLWNGVQNAERNFNPPQSCAYQFRASAWLRATNGYAARMGPYVDTRHVTLIEPSGREAMSDRYSSERPLGMESESVGE